MSLIQQRQLSCSLFCTYPCEEPSPISLQSGSCPAGSSPMVRISQALRTGHKWMYMHNSLPLLKICTSCRTNIHIHFFNKDWPVKGQYLWSNLRSMWELLVPCCCCLSCRACPASKNLELPSEDIPVDAGQVPNDQKHEVVYMLQMGEVHAIVTTIRDILPV